MKLTNVRIKNFRLLKEVTLNLEEVTTVIVGKNNSGKTSFSRIFKLFLNGKDPSFDDFSLECHDDFIDALNKYRVYTTAKEEDKASLLEDIQKVIPKIALELDIHYDDTDNWSYIRPFLTDLSDSDVLSLRFEYCPIDTSKFLEKIEEVLKGKTDKKTRIKAIRNSIDHYHAIIAPVSETETTKTVKLTDVQRLITSGYIDAQRSLDDSDSGTSGRLSSILHNQYQKVNKEDEKKSENLIESLEKANQNIDIVLKEFFNSFIKSLEQFGYPSLNDNQIEILSQLDASKMFTDNTKLFYRGDNDESMLPEGYNGLGYSNLFYIIAKIKDLRDSCTDCVAGIRILFIEEPEAHMHPQMQMVFIKNIEAFFNKLEFKLQLVVTTHSSHILAHSDFGQIRYFNKVKEPAKFAKAIVKDLKDIPFEKELESKSFLKQYLLLDRCDLFFADKAILVEGTVERLLLPVFIEKIEKEDTKLNKLSEEYVTAIEVGGAYMHKFKELLQFIGLKTLIITDIDSIDAKSREKQEVILGTNLITSNAALISWIPKLASIEDLVKDNVIKVEGLIRVAYQTYVNDKCGRSFEEAFVIENHDYIKTNQDSLLSIVYKLKKLDNVLANSYDIQDYIDKNKKKTDFTFDLLTVKKDDWKVPSYIKEGLLWLAK